MTLFENATEYAERCGISDRLKSAPAVLCAYSGGADSSVLLHFLKDFLKNTKVVLYAAHLNHMIRGEEADADERFCRKTCEKLGVELFCERINIPEIAERTGEGLEECARRERYAFFERTARKIGEGTVTATAHNATDNTETVIFNLARGTSVHGLGGISPERRLAGGNCFIVRPLLCLTGAEIRSFASENGIEFVTDKTNFDTDYTRNLIRHKIVPSLEKINPRADTAVLRLSQSAREDDEFLCRAAADFTNGRKYIPRNELSALDRAVASRVVMLLCERENGRKNITEKNISDCLKLALSGKNGSVCVHGCRFFAHSDAVFAEKSTAAAPSIDRQEADLKIGEFTEINGFAVGVFENCADIPPLSENIYNLFIQDIIDRDKMYGKLFVRSRRAGDRFYYHGVNRKLKKLMCDEKIPERIRDALPLICDEEKILYVPGISGGKINEENSEKTLRVLVYTKSVPEML